MERDRLNAGTVLNGLSRRRGHDINRGDKLARGDVGNLLWIQSARQQILTVSLNDRRLSAQLALQAGKSHVGFVIRPNDCVVA
jgi:hypothetical protein